MELAKVTEVGGFMPKKSHKCPWRHVLRGGPTLTLCLLLVSCAGSPKITVNKNVTILVGDSAKCSIEQCGRFLPIWINVEYTTKSELDTDLDVKQDIKPETTIPLPF